MAASAAAEDPLRARALAALTQLRRGIEFVSDSDPVSDAAVRPAAAAADGRAGGRAGGRSSRADRAPAVCRRRARQSDLADVEQQRERLLEAIDAERREIAALETQLAERASVRQTQHNIEQVVMHLLQFSDRRLRSVVADGVTDDDGAAAVGAAGDEEARTREQLRSLATFTGLSFSGAYSVVLPGHTGVPARRVRRYTLQGASYGIDFSAEMDVVEPENRITRLSVALPDETLSEMGAFVERVCRDCALQAFLRGLSRYARLNMQRAHLLRHLRERYGDCVVLPHGAQCAAVVHLANPTRTRLRFTFTLRIRVPPDGRAVPEAHLHSTTVAGVDDPETAAALREVPRNFRKLAAVRGLQNALELLASFVQAGRFAPVP